MRVKLMLVAAVGVASRGPEGSVLAFSGELWRRWLTSSPPRAREPRGKRPCCSETERIKAPAWESCGPPGFLCCSGWCGGPATGGGVRLFVCHTGCSGDDSASPSLPKPVFEDGRQIYVVGGTGASQTTLSLVCQDRGQGDAGQSNAG